MKTDICLPERLSLTLEIDTDSSLISSRVLELSSAAAMLMHPGRLSYMTIAVAPALWTQMALSVKLHAPLWTSTTAPARMRIVCRMV